MLGFDNSKLYHKMEGYVFCTFRLPYYSTDATRSATSSLPYLLRLFPLLTRLHRAKKRGCLYGMKGV